MRLIYDIKGSMHGFKEIKTTLECEEKVRNYPQPFIRNQDFYEH